MARRRYSDEERAAALAALKANGGRIRPTAQQVGVPVATLQRWAADPDRPGCPELRIKKERDMAAALDRVAWNLVESIEKDYDGSLSQRATALGIVIEKSQLLKGRPTNIDEHRADERLRQFRDDYPPPGADEPVDAGADRPAQPPDPKAALPEAGPLP